VDELVGTLASYVPVLLLDRLLQDSTPTQQPIADRYSAVVVFIDISGFTTLTEQFIQSDSAGLEDLTQILNANFSHIIDLIYRYGGDVFKFAGDALLAIWVADSSPETLSPQVLHAAQCALAIQESVQARAIAKDVSLLLRIGIAAGPVVVGHLGGLYKRWECTLSGAPLLEMQKLQKQAQPGWVVISTHAWRLIQPYCQGIPLPDGNIRLLSTYLGIPILPPKSVNFPQALEERLKAYIPAAILTRLSAGHREWLAEYRWVTLIFAHFPNLENISLQQAQDAMIALQKSLYHFEGSINKISIDEKGATLVAALGLPPFAHENDAERGVRAAMAMQAALKNLGWNCSIGVTTGNVFCGVIGSSKRREYTVIGNVANLAARLMQVTQNAILCDAATYEAARHRITFRALPAIALKGIEQPITAYQPIESTHHRTPEPISLMVGYQTERRYLIDSTEAHLQHPSSSVIVIEGEAGIGKTQLMSALLLWIQAQRISYAIGSGDAIERLTPYYPWRQILSQLLQLDDLPNPATRRIHLSQSLQLPAEFVPLMPLLNLILGVDFWETDLTQEMAPSVHAENTRFILLEVLRHCCETSQPIIFLENAQWLDSASWGLILAVCQQSFPIQFVMVTRPLSPSPEYQQLQQLSIVQSIQLRGLSREDTAALICQKLNATSVSNALISLIYEKTEGHPLYSAELAQTLFETGRTQLQDPDRQLTLETPSSVVFAMPTTLQSIITDRIDHLLPPQQLTLKTASVIGRRFTYPLLHDIYPFEGDKVDLQTHIQGLQQVNLIAPVSPSSSLTYSFQSLITQDVAYQSMLFTQRRNLHREIAQWYERHQVQDLALYYPMLVHHWSRAKEPAKTLQYLVKAGEQTFQEGAYTEAIAFFTKALSLEDFNESQSPLQKAGWYRQIAEAHLELGQVTDSILQLQAGVTLLGSPIPETKKDLFTQLLKHLLLQIRHLLWPSSRELAPSSAHTTRLELTRAHVCLGEVYYYTHRRSLATYASLVGLNLAETVPPSPELASIYANMCYVVGMNKLHRLARHYTKLAKQTIQRIDAPLSCQGWVLLVTGAYKSGTGQWQSSHADLQQAADIFHQLRDRHHWAEALAAIALIDHCQGTFNTALDLWKQTFKLGEEVGDRQAQSWGLLGQAEEYLCLGQYHDAQYCVQQARVVLSSQEKLDCEHIRLEGVSALVSFLHGDVSSALECAFNALAIIQQSPPIALYVMEGYASVLEVYILLWQQQPELIQPHHRNIRLARKAMHQYANAFGIGQPRILRLEGCKDWLEGKHNKAMRLWLRSLSLAKQLAMPLEQGRSHYEIGIHLAVNASQRQTRLAEASRIFNALGAQQDLRLTQSAIEFER
jgi:class 3 adenylate cyclase/tetratricopeptide (TPR) repeat protein